jgi:hypothetical protein
MGLFNFIDRRFKRKHTEFNHMKFIIPVSNIPREEAEETVKTLMGQYKVVDVFDVKDDSGEIEINGKYKIPFEKEFWFPVNSNKK